MKYLSWLGVACLALVAASCAPAAYSTGTPSTTPANDVIDFNGQWQLVTNRSDVGQSWLDDRNRFEADNTWGTTGTRERVRYGAWFLPDEFRIDGDRRTLHIEDTGGGVIADVAFDNSASYGSYDNGTYADRGVRAHWTSRRRFQVERAARSGRSITQTFSLENRGRQLVVSTEVDRDGNTRSYTRVYERV